MRLPIAAAQGVRQISIMLPNDPLHRLLAINAMSGLVIGLLVSIGAVVFNTGHLRDLLLKDSGGLIAFALLAFGFMVMIASVMMGAALMSDESYRGAEGNRKGPLRP